MPTFFNPQALTPEQAARWDWAMAEYARIQEANALRALSRMTPAQVLEAKQAFQLSEAAPESALRERMAAFQGLMGGGAGDPKSGGVAQGPRIFTHPQCHHVPEVYDGIAAAPSEHLLKTFFAARR